MEDLTITLIQTNLFWEERDKNLDHFEALLNSFTEETDLILLPETFNSGFSINPRLCAESMDGPSVRFLRQMADRKQAAIMATLIIREGENHFNRMICMHPGGEMETYDKRHLFRLSDEYKIFDAGTSKKIFRVRGWKILPIICYDLRFPVWSKSFYSHGEYAYDLLVCLANWPASRAHIWKTLITARGIENQAYAAGVNRIGNDGNSTWHSGDSMVTDAKGNTIVAAEPGKEFLKTVTLSALDLKLYRDSLTVGLDWDRFTIHLNG